MKKNSIINALLFLFVLGFATKGSSQTYCNSNFTNVSYEYVKNVTYAGINNTTNGTTGGPVNYTALGPANVTVGTANNLSVTIQVDGNEYVFAFIDWNHNGTLNDAGEVYTLATNVSTPGPFTVSVTPPPAAYIGTTRMRVMLAFANATPNPCLSATYGEAEDYTVNVQAAVNCSSVTFPSSASVSTTPSSICLSGNVTLNMTTSTAMPSASGITYKWQSSAAAGGPFTDIPGAVTTAPTYTTTTPVTATTYFRCLVLCNATTTVLTSAASPAVVVTNPGTVTPVAGSRCGPGSVALSATPSIPANTIAWYATATGGLPLATGNNFTTPYLPVTTTYYVDAEMQGTPVTGTIGAGTIQNQTYEYPTPYGQYYGAAHDQYLIRASELYAAGLSAGNFTSIAFDLAQAYGGNALSSYQIQMANTSVNALATSGLITTGFTPVVPAMASYMPPSVAGFATIPFTTPFVWDGVSNVVVDISFTNCSTCNNTNSCVTSYSNNGVVKQTSTSFVSAHSYYDDNNCSVSSMSPSGTFLNNNTYSQRPNIRFATQPVCASPRQAVVATITPSPAVSIARPATTCADKPANFVVSSSPMSNYSNYAWTPNIADLYTNANATTPYAGGNATNIYFRSAVNGAHTYYLFSSGATPAACTHADTFSIWVQPDSISIKGAPDSICVSGTTTLSLQPVTGYAPNSVQWQESATGSNFANITGATNPTYTTPTLTANHYYRALVKSTNDTCEMPVKYIVVVNPQLIGVTDSFNCGPGTVTLKAQTGGNSTAKWYDSPTGGSPIGGGSPWTTPSLSASQTYYVSAEGGAGGGAPVLVTVGTGTTANAATAYPTPFGNYYGASHDQYLVLASDLLSQGASPGNITSIAFDLSNAYTDATLKNFEIKLGNTAATALNTTFIATSMTIVRPAANYTPPAATGYTTIPFTNTFNWTGGNIVVDVSFTNCTTCNNTNSCVTNYTNNGRVRQTNTTFVSSHSAYDDNNCSVSSMTPSGIFLSNATFSKRPNMRFGAQAPCQTPRMAVHANIYPKPVVDLGQDINMCVDGGAAIVLDAGVQPNNPAFLWDNQSTSQVRAVNTSGTYNVKVTNSYTCTGSDTINVLLRKNPVVDLGNDTTVCNGVTLTLNPGGGSIEYFWNTGQTGQIIDVNAAGTYSVFVTNAEGCVMSDTIQISMQGELPTIGGIQVSNNGENQFHFTAVYPQNVIGYDWDFGDGSLHSYAASPIHRYDSIGDYVVVLRLSSTCGFANDTVGAHIVGIRQLNITNDELTVYPNPSNGQATILNKGDLKMEKIEIYNILGQVVYRSKADAKDKHVVNLSNIASGLYTIEVYTDKGTVARKLEILK